MSHIRETWTFPEYSESFFEFIKDSGIIIWWEWKEKIQRVISRFETHFSKKLRITGENYSSHLVEVAKLYVENSSSNVSFDSITIALLHDSLEDILEETFETLQKDFWNIVALWVAALSKPDIQYKAERDTFYYSRFQDLQSLQDFLRNLAHEKGIHIDEVNIQKLARELIKIKLCDRVHNLRTMPLSHYNPQKREEKANETLKYFSLITRELKNLHISWSLDTAISYIFQWNTRYKTQKKVWETLLNI